MNSDLVQLTHIILYRLEKSVENSGEHFLNLKPGNDVRSPNEIISHLVDVSNYGLSLLDLPKAGNTSKSLLEKINENLMAKAYYNVQGEIIKNDITIKDNNFNLKSYDYKCNEKCKRK